MLVTYLSTQGSAFTDQIHRAMQNNTFFNTQMLPYNRTEEGSALYSSYYNVVLRTFPDFLEEIKGIADGANITFSEVCPVMSAVHTPVSITDHN